MIQQALLAFVGERIWLCSVGCAIAQHQSRFLQCFTLVFVAGMLLAVQVQYGVFTIFKICESMSLHVSQSGGTLVDTRSIYLGCHLLDIKACVQQLPRDFIKAELSNIKLYYTILY